MAKPRRYLPGNFKTNVEAQQWLRDNPQPDADTHAYEVVRCWFGVHDRIQRPDDEHTSWRIYRTKQKPNLPRQRYASYVPLKK